ncbi:MAG: nuclear transport factor 2 family protein [Streptomyces sp.]|nr:nuclear transport factor 2 family protein [Streptomyces sp.]NUT30102.1 nuclear transport factor 2 family protein [Streptomyces sp.]
MAESDAEGRVGTGPLGTHPDHTAPLGTDPDGTDPVGTDLIGVVRRFNAAINDRNLDALASLMSDEHTFVDSEGGVVRGKPACLEAWRGFFAAFPDYRNTFDDLIVRGDVVAVRGYSVCSRPELAGPALWTARVSGAVVDEWRVYTDSPEVRREFGLPLPLPDA